MPRAPRELADEMVEHRQPGRDRCGAFGRQLDPHSGLRPPHGLSVAAAGRRAVLIGSVEPTPLA